MPRPRAAPHHARPRVRVIHHTTLISSTNGARGGRRRAELKHIKRAPGSFQKARRVSGALKRARDYHRRDDARRLRVRHLPREARQAVPRRSGRAARAARETRRRRSASTRATSRRSSIPCLHWRPRTCARRSRHDPRRRKSASGLRKGRPPLRRRRNKSVLREPERNRTASGPTLNCSPGASLTISTNTARPRSSARNFAPHIMPTTTPSTTPLGTRTEKT